MKIGVYAPDAFGNERLVDGMRPDGLMLTGKFRDAEAGLIYFGHRWYDAERGRWMSEEPLGLDGPNLYQFVYNDPINSYDLYGLLTVIIDTFGDEVSLSKANVPKGDVYIPSNDPEHLFRVLKRIAPNLEVGDRIEIHGHGGSPGQIGFGPLGGGEQLYPEDVRGRASLNLPALDVYFEACNFGDFQMQGNPKAYQGKNFPNYFGDIWHEFLGRNTTLHAYEGEILDITLFGVPFQIHPKEVTLPERRRGPHLYLKYY